MSSRPCVIQIHVLLRLISHRADVQLGEIATDAKLLIVLTKIN
jgi:hypothetical protein